MRLRILTASLVWWMGVCGIAIAQAPVAGRNVNMVSGTTFPDGDPFLQRQNEPSIAVSTRNPLHLIAGANDYRAVDLPGLPTNNSGDAWLGVFKSFDGGATWKSTLLPGCPQNIPTCAGSPLKGYDASSDPVMRPGTNGLFYYAGIAFNRGTKAASALFMARFIDNNNKENGDPIQYLGTNIIATGTPTVFVDKPWMATDIPRTGAQTCNIVAGGATQSILAGNVYVVYSAFTGLNNEPQDVRSDLLFTRSRDCGTTWSAPIKLTAGDSLAQGATMAVEPLTGTVWVAWRQFATPGLSNSIMTVRSIDAGATFSAPVTVATITPFDQPNNAFGFRTNSYPTLAVDAATPARAYLAWSQRGLGPSTDTRIVLSTSTDGTNWSAAKLMETFVGRGHQVMPALTFAAGKLMLLYYDQRETTTTGALACPTATCNSPAEYTEVRPLTGDLALGAIDKVFNQQLMDAAPPSYNPAIDPVLRRQTIDVRVAQATPGPNPSFSSVRVSQYSFGNGAGAPQATKPVGQLRYNAPNVPLFAGGTRPFMGDYIDIAPSPLFVATQAGTRTVWSFNSSSTGPVAFHAAWTDNRDIIPPRDGDWTKYTPPKVVTQSTFDPTITSPVCEDERTGMRDQNIYTARITQGLLMGSPANTKPLSTTLQRTFIVYLQNNTPAVRRFRLSFPGGTALAGGRVSFLPNSVTAQLDVSIAPFSSATRTVFATSSDAKARIAVNANEIVAPGGALVVGGLSNNVVLNPDASNPALTNPDIIVPGGSGDPIGGSEIFNPDLTNPDLTNPDLTNPDLTNPDLTNPDLTNPDLTNPDLTNPGAANPDLTNPVIANPDLTNPDLTNPDLTNNVLVDGTYRVTNLGNTTAPYTVKLLQKAAIPANVKLQLVVYKVYTTPAARGCTLSERTHNELIANVPNPKFSSPADVQNPDLTNPDLTNVTMYLEPGQTARVTLRILAPTPQAATDLLTTTVKPGITSQAPNILLGTILPNPVALIVTTLGIPNGIRNLAYSTTLAALGGKGTLTWSLVSGSLPVGITLNPATGVISGTTVNPGAYPITVRVTDSSNPAQVDNQPLNLIIADVLAVTSPAQLQPPAKVNVQPAAQLTASGGIAPFSWSLIGGALPGGVTLNPNGTFSGKPSATGSATFTVKVTDAGNPGQTATKQVSLDVLAEPFLLSIAPASGVQGKTTSVTITGQGTSFTQGVTSISAGVGITAGNIVVASAVSLTADLTIAPGATLGLRSVTVTTLTENLTLTNAFNVLARPIVQSILPNSAARTQTLDLTITGAGTSFTQGVTTVTFSGGGITLNSVTVTSKTLATANITVDAAAALGPRDVTVTTGAETDTVVGGLTIADVFGTVSGIVLQVDGVTASPGATVRLYRGSPLAPFAVTIANALGAFTLPNTPSGAFTLYAADAAATQLGMSTGSVVTSGATVTSNVLLNGTGTVNVTVLGAGSVPVAGAPVTVTTQAFTVPAEFQAIGTRQAAANGSGMASFANFMAGALGVVATNPAGTYGGNAGATLLAGGTLNVTITLVPPEVVSAVFTVSNGSIGGTSLAAGLNEAFGKTFAVGNDFGVSLPPGQNEASSAAFTLSNGTIGGSSLPTGLNEAFGKTLTANNDFGVSLPPGQNEAFSTPFTLSHGTIGGSSLPVGLNEATGKTLSVNNDFGSALPPGQNEAFSQRFSILNGAVGSASLPPGLNEAFGQVISILNGVIGGPSLPPGRNEAVGPVFTVSNPASSPARTKSVAGSIQQQR